MGPPGDRRARKRRASPSRRTPPPARGAPGRRAVRRSGPVARGDDQGSRPHPGRAAPRRGEGSQPSHATWAEARRRAASADLRHPGPQQRRDLGFDRGRSTRTRWAPARRPPRPHDPGAALRPPRKPARSRNLGAFRSGRAGSCRETHSLPCARSKAPDGLRVAACGYPRAGARWPARPIWHRGLMPGTDAARHLRCGRSQGTAGRACGLASGPYEGASPRRCP